MIKRNPKRLYPSNNILAGSMSAMGVDGYRLSAGKTTPQGVIYFFEGIAYRVAVLFCDFQVKRQKMDQVVISPEIFPVN